MHPDKRRFLETQTYISNRSRYRGLTGTGYAVWASIQIMGMATSAHAWTSNEARKLFKISVETAFRMAGGIVVRFSERIFPVCPQPCRDCAHSRSCRGNTHLNWNYNENRPLVRLKGILFERTPPKYGFICLYAVFNLPADSRRIIPNWMEHKQGEKDFLKKRRSPTRLFQAHFRPSYSSL